MLQLQSTWTCSKRLSASGKWTGNDHFKGHRSFRSCLEAQEFITAVSSEHVPIIEGKLDASNAKLTVDSGSSVSLVEKACFPLACLILRRQQSLRTADGHGMSIVGMVRLKVQLGSYTTEHELLVAEHLLMPVILGVDFLLARCHSGFLSEPSMHTNWKGSHPYSWQAGQGQYVLCRFYQE